MTALEKSIRHEALHAAACGHGRPEPSASSDVGHEGETTRLRILVAEDNSVNQEVARRILAARGHTVDVAANGAEALASVRKRPYDLVLMDMQMPEMDGLAATRAIRALGGRAAEVPIVALTANALMETRDACLAAGMNGFVAKPFNRDRLFAVVTEAVERRRADWGDKPPAEGLLDLNVVEDLTGVLGGDAFLNVVRTLAVNGAERIAKMTQHAAARRPAEFAQEAHALKGAVSTVGLPALAREAAGFEELGFSGSADLAFDPRAFGRLLDESVAALIDAVERRQDASHERAA